MTSPPPVEWPTCTTIKLTHQRRDIGGVGIHVVSGIGLIGATMATPIMGDHPKSLAKEEQHLVIPVVCTERPTMVEHDRLAVFRPPILVEDADAVARDYRGHERVSLMLIFVGGG